MKTGTVISLFVAASLSMSTSGCKATKSDQAAIAAGIGGLALGALAASTMANNDSKANVNQPPHNTYPQPPHNTYPQPPHNTYPQPPHNTYPQPLPDDDY
jgi:hypothetical protein